MIGDPRCCRCFSWALTAGGLCASCRRTPAAYELGEPHFPVPGPATPWRDHAAVPASSGAVVGGEGCDIERMKGGQ